MKNLAIFTLKKTCDSFKLNNFMQTKRFDIIDEPHYVSNFELINEKEKIKLLCGF